MTISIKTGAKAVAKYTGVLLDFLNNTNAKLRPLANIPFIGDTIGDVQDLISMLHDYYHGSRDARNGGHCRVSRKPV